MSDEIKFEGKDDYAEVPDSCIACPHCGEFQYGNDLIANYAEGSFHKKPCEHCNKEIEFKWQIEIQFTVKEVKK